ncbi:hypothetical protein Ddye_026641 [Dipteronia dyeriana]|uniref:Pectinesterase inhibitor domain-containing protein n=1 Tax=Dipteronia dyeriana TaxID=168575 RepID=A0AAD9TMQ5_9ROSI|nr:hypothetical protein Ddye_026641 [Dipteronia dyeriana]
MTNPTCFYLHLLMLSIVLHVLFVNQNIATAISNNDEVSLIRNSCDGTHYLGTCLSVLEADSRSKSATDLKSLTRISMDIVCEEAIGLKSLFTAAEKNITDPNLIKNVKKCIEVSDYCNYRIKTFGIPDFEEGNYRFANISAKDCVDCATDCSFTGIKLFNKEIVTLHDFSADVQDFINMLQN